MSTVGSHFGALANMRKVARLPINPLDRSTIVSIYEKQISINNPTLFPGSHIIPAATPDGFELLVVKPASWFKEMEEGQPFLEIQNSSIQVAESIIRDYSNGLVGCNMGDRMPGLFYVPGEFTKITIRSYEKFSFMLEMAKMKQKNWFTELVKIADVDWARTNGNPRAISDDSRLAAQKLGLQKAWMQDFRAVELSNCVACGHLINKNYPVCPNCKNVIDVEKAKSLGLKFAV